MYFMTVDQGRTHIASDSKYLGHVNSYNNRFTQFFAKTIFRIGIDITVEGKKRCFNKTSYRKWLKSCGLEIERKELKNSTDLSTLQIDETGKGLIKTFLTSQKIEKLTKKLINALLSHDENRAFQLVGKGADVNRLFWERGAYGSSSHSYTEGLARFPIQLEATQYTPFLLAAQKKMTKLFDFMKQVGGDQKIGGRIVDFKRIHIDTQVHYQNHFHMHRQPYYVVDRWGRPRFVGATYHPDVYTTTHVHRTYRDLAYQTATTRLVNDVYQVDKHPAPLLVKDRLN